MLSKICKVASPPASAWSIHSLMRLYPDQNAPRWSITQAMSNYVGLLAKTLDCPYNDDLKAFDLWWMKNPATNASITEIGIGLHYNGLLSTIIVPSYFASDTIIQQFASSGIDFRLYQGAEPRLFSHNECRKIITVMHAQKDFASLDETMSLVQRQAACSANVLELIDKLKAHVANLPIADIQEEVDNLCKHTERLSNQVLNGVGIMDADRENGDRLQHALDKKINWPHFLAHWLPVFNYPSIPDDAALICNTATTSTTIPNQRYCKELHDEFPDGRTATTRALLEDDENAFYNSIAKDPHAAIKQDAYGLDPLSFCIYTGNSKYLPYLYDVCQSLTVSCPWLQNRLSLTKHFLAYPQVLQRNASGDMKAAYIAMESYRNAERSAIHHACAAGDVEKVKQILDETPDAVNAIDPWGMTPIIIALGKDNLDLIRLLLEKDSHKTVLSQMDFLMAGIQPPFSGWGLLESAKSPEAVRLLLMHRVAPNQLTQLVWEAVWSANIDLLKWFYRYRRDDIQNESGLKLIELAIYKANASLQNASNEPNAAMAVLDWMLQQISFPLCDTDWDQTVHPVIREKICQHNLRLKEKMQLLESRPKCIASEPVVLDEKARCLYTYMKKGAQEFTLAIKSTADLSADEREQIYTTYEEFFQKNNITPVSKEAFFEDNFPQARKKNVFVELCFVNNRIVSFISFMLIESEFPDIGRFDLYYGKLGATKGYNRNGLIETNFRLPQALHLLNRNDTPIWVFYKSIRPGGSWMLIDSVGFEAFPKFTYNEEFMRHIVRLSHEEMHTSGRIRANLVVQVPMSDVPLIQEYSDLAGSDPRDAVAVIYPVTTKSVEHALKTQLHFNGFDYKILHATAVAFEKLRAINNQLIETEIPAPKM